MYIGVLVVGGGFRGLSKGGETRSSGVYGG